MLVSGSHVNKEQIENFKCRRTTITVMDGKWLICITMQLIDQVSKAVKWSTHQRVTILPRRSINVSAPLAIFQHWIFVADFSAFSYAWGFYREVSTLQIYCREETTICYFTVIYDSPQEEFCCPESHHLDLVTEIKLNHITLMQWQKSNSLIHQNNR